MGTYNGYESSETKTRTRTPVADDKGHTIVERKATRRGSSHSFTFKHTCQCGKVFRSKRDETSLFYRWTAHLRAEGVTS